MRTNHWEITRESCITERAVVCIWYHIGVLQDVSFETASLNAGESLFDTSDEALYESIARALCGPGHVALANAVPGWIVDQLRERVYALDADDFERAGVGRETAYRVNRNIRQDRIYRAGSHEPGMGDYLVWIERLRLQLNRRLFLGLFDFECHYACYPAGAVYRRHVDAFRGDVNRVLSVVLYLNSDWRDEHGGALLLYAADEAMQPCARILPQLGKLVVFLSEEFPHEVLPARRDRYSVTGWFRVNTSIGGNLDLPR